MTLLLAIPQASASFLEQVMLLGGLFETHSEFWLWLTLALMVSEIFTAGFFLGVLSISALLAAGVSWMGVGYQGQIVWFSIFSVASLVWLRPLFVKLLSKEDVATNAPALVGVTGTVVEQVPADGFGRVRLSNEEWRATSTENLQVGDTVRVYEVKGNTVTVSKS